MRKEILVYIIPCHFFFYILRVSSHGLVSFWAHLGEVWAVLLGGDDDCVRECNETCICVWFDNGMILGI